MERTRARFQRAGRQIAPALETRLKENLIRKMVEEELIAQKAKAEGVKRHRRARLAGEVRRAQGRFGSDKAFDAFLERTQPERGRREGATSRRTCCATSCSRSSWGPAEPTDADAKKYYEENKDKYKQKEQIKASHILFKVDKHHARRRQEAEARQAKKVVAEAKKPGVDFGELAKKHSEGPTASAAATSARSRAAGW
jgi:peptidyl-prolyl cis-trans isomerase C